MRERNTRVVLIVAPDVLQRAETLRAFDLDASKDGLRFIDKAYSLRGWSRGTAYLAIQPGRWSTPRGVELDQALTALTRSGQLRIANERDLASLRKGSA
ncbi:hypothetical protein ACIQUB_06140 [Rhizobium sp. NPDC090275]|uniref:hypothetical protein n=1 Tax=Rhizobium sp. NPDC090275 TaxID=3364498 RepID=UPI00383A0899